jgi:hypothetical protein
VGFTAEWALALQSEVFSAARTRVPELVGRWPLQGIRFDACAVETSLVLIVHSLPERAMPSGPSSPVISNDIELPLPGSPAEFASWDEVMHIRHGLHDTDLLCVVPFPAAAASDDFAEPSEQWNQFTDSERAIWSASVDAGFRRGLLGLLRRPDPQPPDVAKPSEPITNPLYTPHQDFAPPADLDQPIWRYMSMTKFIALLERRAVFFARADLLGDPWEGGRGQANARAAEHLYPDGVSPLDRATHLIRQIAVSCWHAQDGESAAMWSLYAGWNPLQCEGLAIRSTFRRLLESVQGDNQIYAGQVLYQDYGRDFIPEDNLFVAFMRKRRSFEHEREIRAMLMRDKEIATDGVEVPADLDRLVSEVRVAPSAPRWLRELIEDLVVRYRLDAPVRQSAMDEQPLG